LTSPLANAVLSWRSVEGHRSLSRRRIIRGPAHASTLFSLFFRAAESPVGQAPIMAPKQCFFPEKTPRYAYRGCDGLTREAAGQAGVSRPSAPASAKFRNRPATAGPGNQSASRAARQSLYSCWSIRTLRKRSRCSLWGISKLPKRSSSALRASVAPA
jgi:hypothetical protein